MKVVFKVMSERQKEKEGVEEQLIARTEALFPGVKERIVFQESATPVTTRRYTGASEGVSYGIAATVEQPGERAGSALSQLKASHAALAAFLDAASPAPIIDRPETEEETARRPVAKTVRDSLGGLALDSHAIHNGW